MKKIFKYELEVVANQEIEMPGGAEILCVQSQKKIMCLWAVVDPEMATQTRKIRIHGTGHDIPDTDSLSYIGTVQMLDGQLIWHVFEEWI